MLPEQLLRTSLVRCKTSNLSNKVPDKLVVFGQLALGLAWLGLQSVLGGLVTLLKADTNLVSGSHDFSENINTKVTALIEISKLVSITVMILNMEILMNEF